MNRQAPYFEHKQVRHSSLLRTPRPRLPPKSNIPDASRQAFLWPDAWHVLSGFAKGVAALPTTLYAQRSTPGVPSQLHYLSCVSKSISHNGSLVVTRVLGD